MKTKSKTGRPIDPVIAFADKKEHAKLRQILKDGEWTTYGDLRRRHSINPSRLEYALQTYPMIFEVGEALDGKPTIRLRPGSLESREDILCRRTSVKSVQRAGATGIYLKNLYLATRIDSKTVQRLLNDVEGVEARTTRLGSVTRILYKWIGAKEAAQAEKSPIQDSMSLPRQEGRGYWPRSVEANNILQSGPPRQP